MLVFVCPYKYYIYVYKRFGYYISKTPRSRLTLVATPLFFPRHLTASGHIEPGSSGHMRPGGEMAYPSSPSPHHICCRALDTFSIDIISFNYVYVARQVGNWLFKYIHLFDKLKETFKFWANCCHVKGSLPPLLHTQDGVTKSCVRKVKTRGAVTWQIIFFLPSVAGFPWPRSHITWTFGFLVLFL
jgi:hypothetical protein